MSSIPVYTLTGGEAGNVEVADGLLCRNGNRQLIQDAITAYRANQRAGTAATKTKSTVIGTNKKPWKQKGSGNARAGYRQSPIWRGGGVAFGPHPRSYRKQMTKKASRLAFAMALTEQIDSGALTVVDDINLDSPKTKPFAEILNGLGAQGATLLVVADIDDNLGMASRNIPFVEVAQVKDLNTFQLVRYPRIIMTRDALPGLEERLQRRTGSSS
jgi:large subunit ribosomal protein L4